MYWGASHKFHEKIYVKLARYGVFSEIIEFFAKCSQWKKSLKDVFLSSKKIIKSLKSGKFNPKMAQIKAYIYICN